MYCQLAKQKQLARLNKTAYNLIQCPKHSELTQNPHGDLQKHKGSRPVSHHSAGLHLGTVSVSLVYPMTTRKRAAVGYVERNNPRQSFSLKLIGPPLIF